MQPLLTTPFGRRTMSLAMAARQIATQQAQPEASVHKWRLFRTICEARELLGPSDRALVVLNALLTFLPETEMSVTQQLVVFPSNAMLAARAHGMAPATLRRHLASLVALGLIIRRDSPNGKRYARKSRSGDIETAYGFDLAPLVARAEEINALANEVADARRQRQTLRERVTLARRHCAKLLAASAGLYDDDAWRAHDAAYQRLAGTLPRSADALVLAARADALETLQAEITRRLQDHINLQPASGNESQTERHIQNSDKEDIRIEAPQVQMPPATCQQASPPQLQISWRLIMDACPDLNDYARTPISNWRQLCDAADLARAAMGISPDLWRQFCHDAGEVDAAAVIGAMLQRMQHIANPSAYLRALHARLCTGRFRPGPMLAALSRPPIPPSGLPPTRHMQVRGFHHRSVAH